MVFGGDCDFVRSVMVQFERHKSYRFNMKDKRVREGLQSLATFSVRATDEIIADVTEQCVRQFGYLPCPHSATGIFGAMQIQKRIQLSKS